MGLIARSIVARLITHVAARRVLLQQMQPLDEKAKTVQFARLNELEQLTEACGLTLPTAPESADAPADPAPSSSQE